MWSTGGRGFFNPAKLFRRSVMGDLSQHPADDAENPIVGVWWDVSGPRYVPTHRHRRGQLIYTERGSVTVEAQGTVCIAPAFRAVWVPPGVDHSARYPRDVAFRGIFIAPERCLALPARCAVVQVDPLTRELIHVAARMPWNYEADGPDARLMQVLLDRLTGLSVMPLYLPDGRDERVRRVMAALRASPADERRFRDWAAFANLSERSLARRFTADTGMSFTAWRQQLRIVAAVERLAAGDSVTSVAFDLGYRTTSSFSTMFKRALGVPPSAYF